MEFQSRHFSHEEQGKKHHHSGAQDWDLAPRDKEEAQSLMQEHYVSQTSNKALQIGRGPGVGTNLSLVPRTGNKCGHYKDLGSFASNPRPDAHQRGTLETLLGDNSPWASPKFACLVRGTDYTLFQIYLFKDNGTKNSLGR